LSVLRRPRHKSAATANIAKLLNVIYLLELSAAFWIGAVYHLQVYVPRQFQRDPSLWR
jgi:hypothetical protein